MSAQATTPVVVLADGAEMPQLGYGVWQVPEEIATECVLSAIHAGYRSIDTAAIYGNERGVGEAVRTCGIDRAELFVTTKIWNDRHTDALVALDELLERLGLEQVDLLLIHWPSPARGSYVEAWRGLVEAREAGRARSIGVSNFGVEQLERILDDSGVAPVLNQVELHPWFQQRALREWHEAHGIRTEAWSPLGQGGELLAEPVLVEIARRIGRTPAQVVLRWHLDEGTIAIPKSSTPSRIAENIDLDFRLERDELELIAALDRGDGGRIGPDPATASF